MAQARTILGIDPGTNILGFGVIRIGETGKPEYVDCGVLDLRKIPDPYSRLANIFDSIAELCDRYRPEDIALESPFLDKNAQVIFKLGRAQGAAMIAGIRSGAQIYEYAPRKAKVAICGNGAASKQQVASMVCKTLGMDIENRYLDATDALAIAICHYYQLTSPLPQASGASSWKKFIEANPGRIK